MTICIYTPLICLYTATHYAANKIRLSVYVSMYGMGRSEPWKHLPYKQRHWEFRARQRRRGELRYIDLATVKCPSRRLPPCRTTLPLHVQTCARSSPLHDRHKLTPKQHKLHNTKYRNRNQRQHTHVGLL